MLSRRRFLQTCSGFALSGVGTLGYAGLLEPFWLEFTRRVLPVRRLPPALQGALLVHVSDIHAGGRVHGDYLIESLHRITALQPAVVVYTGDFITLDSSTEEQMARVLPHLAQGSLATLATLGNHDYGRNWSEESWARKIITALEPAGVRVLRNETANVRGLQIVGMDDLWARRFDPVKALRPCDPEGPALVLSHNPDTLDEPGWNGYKGWVLCGHTHGGQCRAPFLPAPILPVRNRRYSAGHIPLADGRQCYISRGLGYLHQVRFNVRPEVTLFTLQPA